MFFKHIRLNLTNLSNEVTRLNLFKSHQQKLTEQLKDNQEKLNENQQQLFNMINKLAGCFQLEYKEGKYFSKKNRKKRRAI